MTWPYSPLQEEANKQTLFLMNEIGNYQRLYNYNTSMSNTPSISSVGRTSYISAADGWDISYQTIEGDFDLDEILAREIASRVAANILDGGWLKDYLNDKSGENAGFDEYLKDASVGPGNISYTTNSARAAGEAAIASQKIAAAEKTIKSGIARSVKINNHMTLYDANSGKGQPRFRIKISGLPAKVVTPLVDLQMLKANRHVIRSLQGGLSVRANAVRNPSGLAGMTSKMRYLNLKGVGGALTFAPTAAVDLYRNFNEGQLDGRQFMIDQAKHQSGNAMGLAGGVLAGAVVVVLGFAGAPVIATVLIGGILTQALWNYSGASNSVGRLAEKILDADLPEIDSRFMCP